MSNDYPNRLFAKWPHEDYVFQAMLCPDLNDYYYEIQQVARGCKPKRLERQGPFTSEDEASFAACEDKKWGAKIRDYQTRTLAIRRASVHHV